LNLDKDRELYYDIFARYISAIRNTENVLVDVTANWQSTIARE